MSHSLIVVGDAILDVDVETAATRLSPDGAAPILEEIGRVTRAGGAALAAHLAARTDPAATVTLVTAVADDAAARTLAAAIDSRIHVIALPSAGSTGVKTRYRAAGRTIVRFDQGGRTTAVDRITDEVLPTLESADAVLVADYGRGVVERVRDVIATVARRVPVVWDPHPRGPVPVPGAALVTPNAPEAAQASGVDGGDVARACRAATALQQRWAVRGVAVTVGAAGAVVADADGVLAVPTTGTVSGDCCGAGDSFAAAATVALAHGALISEAVAAGVAAATEFLQRGGVASLNEPHERETATGADLDERLARVRTAGGKVVATGGCFDLIHAGHVATLTAARELGDFLVVCVNSDASVRRLKGPTRPLQPIADRRRLLESLRPVDAVVVFDEDTPEHVLRRLRPDIWVKGGDYTAAQLPEEPLIASWGGQVVTTPYLDGRSTTDLVDLARR